MWKTVSRSFCNVFWEHNIFKAYQWISKYTKQLKKVFELTVAIFVFHIWFWKLSFETHTNTFTLWHTRFSHRYHQKETDKDQIPDDDDDRACGENQWQCANGECINSEFICDDTDDCVDKSDEDPEFCDKDGSRRREQEEKEQRELDKARQEREDEERRAQEERQRIENERRQEDENRRRQEDEENRRRQEYEDELRRRQNPAPESRNQNRPDEESDRENRVDYDDREDNDDNRK